MGSGASKQLQCPKGYDNDKFALILKLFDRLDQDGDNVVELDELKEIAKLHVENKIRNLQLSQGENTNLHVLELEKIENRKLHAIREVEEKAKIEKAQADAQLQAKIDQASTTITKYQGLSEEERAKKFLGVVSDDQKHINFWKFFDYMKNRTGDIKNIQF